MKKTPFFPILILIFSFISTSSIAQEACCLSHGGRAICNAFTGKIICRDGSTSTSCTCPMNNKIKYATSSGYFYKNCMQSTDKYDHGYCEGTIMARYNAFQTATIDSYGEKYWDCYFSYSNNLSQTYTEYLNLIGKDYNPFTSRINEYLYLHPEIAQQQESQKVFTQIFLNIYPIPTQCTRLKRHLPLALHL